MTVFVKCVHAHDYYYNVLLKLLVIKKAYVCDVCVYRERIRVYIRETEYINTATFIHHHIHYEVMRPKKV